MASKYWLKLYHEMLDDPKVARLPDSSYRRFVECLLLAGELDEGGYLPPVADMAWRVRVTETTMEQDLSRLALAGMVELKEGDRWFVTNFAERQQASDAAERMREYRKRKRKEAKEKEKREELEEDTDTDIDTDTYRAVTGVTKRNGRPQFDIPDALKGEDFEEAFISWFAHCEARNKPLTQVSGDYLLSDLASVGKARAIGIIKHSLKCNYKTLVDPAAQNGNGMPQGGKKKTTAAESYREVFGE